MTVSTTVADHRSVVKLYASIVLTFPPLGFDPLPTQRVPCLYYFEISIFDDGPKKFLRVPSALINTSFEWEGGRQKTQFFGLNFPKSS